VLSKVEAWQAKHDASRGECPEPVEGLFTWLVIK